MNKDLIKILILLIFFQVSCSRDVVDNSIVNNSKFEINILGIDNDTNIEKLGTTSTNHKSDILHQEITKISEDMEAVISVAEVPLKKALSINKVSPNKTASVSNNVLPGSKFRVVFFGPYDNPSDIPPNGTALTNYAGYIDGETINGGPAVPTSAIPLSRNKYYKFIAYSFNDNAAIATFTPNNYNITLPANKEVLYGESFCQIPNQASSSIQLNFSFKRKSVAFEIVLDARGMFGEIAGMGTTTFNGGVASGSMNLFTSQTTASGAATMNPTQPYSKYEAYNFALYNDRVKAVSFYTLAGGAFPNEISITFRNPIITGDRRTRDGFTHASTLGYWGDDHIFAGRTLNLTATNLSSLGLTLTPGKKFRIYATILMTGKTFKERTCLTCADEITWARGNLYLRNRQSGAGVADRPANYVDKFQGEHMIRVHSGSNAYLVTKVETVGSNNYRLVNDASGEYFAWPAANNDPCKKVFPEGYWRMPSQGDYNALITALPTTSNPANNPYYLNFPSGGITNSDVNMAKFFVNNIGNGAATDSPYDPNENRLTFLFLGRETGGNGNPYPRRVVDYGVPNSGAGYYWTNTSSTATTAKVLILKRNSGNVNTGSLAFEDMDKTIKAPIKCIKGNPTSSPLYYKDVTRSGVTRLEFVVDLSQNSPHRPKDNAGN